MLADVFGMSGFPQNRLGQLRFRAGDVDQQVFSTTGRYICRGAVQRLEPWN